MSTEQTGTRQEIASGAKELRVGLISKTWGWNWFGFHRMTLVRRPQDGFWMHANHYYGVRLLGLKVMFGPFIKHDSL